MVSFVSLWKQGDAPFYRDLNTTEAFEDRRRNIANWQKNNSRIISSVQNFWSFNRLSISVRLSPWVKWGMSVHNLCVCVCVCVRFKCAIQEQLSVTRASITGRMSAEITAHRLQRNLSVSCKRWRGRRRISELGKYFSLRCRNQQCSTLQSLK